MAPSQELAASFSASPRETSRGVLARLV